MRTRQLDRPEFLATFAKPMRDVLTSATDVIDVWPYVAAIPENDLYGATIVDGCVKHVYRNGVNTFDHVLVVTRTKNVYLVVVVDLIGDAILGHHVLDLNEEYGLITQH